MCYYNGQKVSRSEFIRLVTLEKKVSDYAFLDDDDSPFVQSGFDYGMTTVLKPNGTRSDFQIVQMEWGFLPTYLRTRQDAENMRRGYKDAKGAFRPPLTTLNAKGEELLQAGKMFREAALKRRCLVLSTGFYEWRHVHRLNKKTGEPLKTADKYPYRIGVKDTEYFFLAGIWQSFEDRQTGEMVETVAIITTDANSLMAQVHNSKNRMPVILPDEMAWDWMMEDLPDDKILELATYQFPAEQMEAYTIQKEFRTALNPLEPCDYPELPALI